MKTINQRAKKLVGKIKHIVNEENKIVVGLSEDADLEWYLRNKFDATQNLLMNFAINTEGTPIKVIAKCSEPDTFDKHIGMDIVDLKIMYKFHIQAYNKLRSAKRYFRKLIKRIDEKILEEDTIICDIEEKLDKYSEGESSAT